MLCEGELEEEQLINHKHPEMKIERKNRAE